MSLNRVQRTRQIRSSTLFADILSSLFSFADVVGTVVAAVVEEEGLANGADAQGSDNSCCCWMLMRSLTVQERVVEASAAKCSPWVLKMLLQLMKMVQLLEYFDSCKRVLLF